MISALRSYACHRRQKKAVQATKEHYLSVVRRHIAIKAIKRRCVMRLGSRLEAERARHWHAEQLYKRAYVAWVQYYRLHRKSIKGYLRLKQAHSKALKSRMMKLWLRRSAPTLTKMRAARFMLRLRQKKLIRGRFQNWVN